MRKYATEFIGTFGLVFTVACVVLTTSALAPLAIGSVLLVMVYAGGHVSGGHYNPAVSLAVYLRGRLPLMDLPAYWLAQILGGGLAAAAANLVISPTSSTPAALSFTGRTMSAALLAEFLFTFALANALRDFRLGGAELDEVGKARFAQLQEEAGLPLFAIGGQSSATFDQAWQHGAHGIAGIRHIVP